MSTSCVPILPRLHDNRSVTKGNIAITRLQHLYSDSMVINEIECNYDMPDVGENVRGY